MLAAMSSSEHDCDVPVRGHSGLVRATHWLTVASFIALLVTGVEILISHPRFYWGEVGNVNTRPLFVLHIPASRNLVPTGYKFVLPDQNGWSRYLHFQAAWVLVLTGVVYAISGLVNGHFRRKLLPWRAHRMWHVEASTGGMAAEQSYNAVQRAAYLVVIFVVSPLIIWTGLALSPAFDSAVPVAVSLLGGRQTARTLHFFLTDALVVFLILHVTMVALSGFRSRMRAMITGSVVSKERS